MTEYLSKEFIAKLLDAHMTDSNGAEHYAYSTLKREFMVAPGSDVVEVKRGHWENNEYGYHCSVCKCDSLYDGFNHPVKASYCSNCGAKMDQVIE